MGEFSECLEGIKQACEFLNYPVVSGNVSFYNGTNKKNIDPTPVIGGVGLIKKLIKPLSHSFKKDKSRLILIGKTFGHLEQSCFLKENYSISDGSPPEINLFNEKNNGEHLLKLIDRGLVLSSHDISSGGLIVALSEMGMTSEFGAKIHKPKKLTNLFKYFFGEDQARYIVEIDDKKLSEVQKILNDGNVYHEVIGFTQKESLEIEGEFKISTKELFKINNEWYNKVLMPLPVEEIKKLIKESLPDASIEIKDLMGDNNHYSATIKSSRFNNLNKIEQHKLVYKSLKGKMGNELHALSITTEGK